MPRPRMQLGEWGKVSLTPQLLTDSGRGATAPAGTRKPDRWRARAKVRDLDGKVRDVERFAPTKASAERVLLQALRERVTPGADDAAIKPSTLIKDAAQVWWAEASASDRAINTKRVYESTLNKHVIGPKDKPAALANLAVREVKVAGVERLLREVSKKHGPGAAKMTRSVLRAVLDLAVKHDAIPHNPVRSVGPVSLAKHRKDNGKDARRAFTVDERNFVMTYADADDKAQERDLGDFIAFMAGTGARIGEACGLRWSVLDLDAATATLGPLVVRVKGEGLTVQDNGKTMMSTRTVALPPWLVERLRARQVRQPRNEWGVVLPSPLGKLRDPSNTSHDVRDLLNAAGFPWASGHTFRKTVATLLDEAGVSGREVANHLGHARPSLTMDVYMNRRTVTERAAEVL